MRITSRKLLAVSGVGAQFIRRSSGSASVHIPKLPRAVSIVEVGPRDGLQNEPGLVSTETKVELIDRLCEAGLKNIEATAFVSPKWVPQMADASQVMSHIQSKLQQQESSGIDYDKINFPVLTPNTKGLDSAIKAGVKEVAIFGAASESFSQKNINCSIEESLDRFKAVVDKAKQANIRVRGYLSTVIACPYEGKIAPKQVAKVAARLLELGCYQVSLGDTIGVGTPVTIAAMLKEVLSLGVEPSRFAMHAHNTYGQGVANCLESLEMGITTLDSSVAGLGGCPYAKGATGNVATEDIVYMLEQSGVSTGINLEKLALTGQWISSKLGRKNGSLAGTAITAKLT